MSLLSGLGEIPAMSPPSGVAPNFVNPENKSLIGVVLGGVMASLMALMIINRAFVKWRVIKKWTKDDLTCVSAFLLGLAYYTVIVIAMQSGNVGVHQYDLKLAHTLDHSYLLACYLSSIFAPMTMIFEKITFLLFYRQLFRPLRWLRIAAFLGVIVTILAYMSFMTVVLVYTTPSKGETFATHYQTLTFEKAIPVGIASSAFGVVIDLYIISLPVMGIHRLKLSPRQRVEVTGLFLTGTLAVAGACISMAYRIVLYKSPDWTYNSLAVFIGTSVEIDVGIMCTCLPSLAITVRRVWPSLKAMHVKTLARFARPSTNTQESRQPPSTLAM